jgi:hypothetical protein
MPGILGSEVAERLMKLKEYKEFRVIMVSADYIHGIDHLIHSTLIKPLDMSVVKEEYHKLQKMMTNSLFNKSMKAPSKDDNMIATVDD